MEVAIARRSVAHARKDDYVLSPLRDPRPATGRAGALVECEECGQAVRCRVYSEADTHRLRARWRLLARLSVVAIVAIVVADAVRLVNLTPDRPASTPVAFLLGFSSVAIAGGILFAVHARRRARDDDGVRIIGWPGPHSLQYSSLRFSD